MAASLTTEAENSSSRSLWEYDVFLSFRGKDVQKSLMSHLNDVFNEEGIKTFHEDRDLQREKKQLKWIPIFYEIDSSNLKSRTGCFSKALRSMS
ncbi:hypothetical protein EUTSA_v10002357mg [Eutrema salsugineum]|uniref:ADP-ribosyl cyclase/cyclic ADP-ribose hydrolase n=1 Tax=Eutrema salsugineum TaxID=72664 RepID=V4KIG2_EUTSA|nr:hypothetical protein EUTSA_v10002357mg [Eutrema salsugineum]